MKKLQGLGALAAALLLLTGCGAPAPTAATHSPSAASPTPTTAAAPPSTQSPTPDMSTRGNFIKHVGVEAGITDPSGGATVATFTVTKIVIDPKCDSSYILPPENGHFVELFMNVATSPKSGIVLPSGFSPGYGWTVIDSNGNLSAASLLTMAASSCLARLEQLPNTINPAEKATGAVILDVPTVSGTLIYNIMGSSIGWEWTYPAG